MNTAGAISSVTAAIGQLKELEGTGGLATDNAGNLHLADRQSHVVRKVDTSGVVTIIAGDGTAGLSGNNGNGSQATSVPICSPSGVAADRAGNVYFGSAIYGTVGKVDMSGALTTFAGNGSPNRLQTPRALAMNNSGNLCACDDGVGTCVYKVTPAGAITIIAGSGTNGFSGDSGPATSAQLFDARGVAVDAAGNVYVADAGNLRVRRVDPNRIITTIAGGPNTSPNEVDGGPPTGVNGALLTSLDGVSVTIGGQLNVLAPDAPAGPITATVTTAGGMGLTFATTTSAYRSAFFTWPKNQVVARRQDHSYAVKAGTFAGATTVRAKSGDVIVLWATGCGPAMQAAPAGASVPASVGYPTASVPTVTISNTRVTVDSAALASGAAGLYRIAIQVPSSLADGDCPFKPPSAASHRLLAPFSRSTND